MTSVLMRTSAGDITIELFDDKAPKTVENFLKLVDKGFYNGLHFHRVIKDFMLQGGCPNSKDPNNPKAGTGGPGYQINCEFHSDLKHNKPGLLSMANAGPNTGGSQFFLTTVATPWLDGAHAIFGEVTQGMNTVQKIENCKTYKGEKIANLIVESKKTFKAINCPTRLNSSAIDEFLLIFLVAAKARGMSYFKNLSELNQKESPRLLWLQQKK